MTTSRWNRAEEEYFARLEVERARERESHLEQPERDRLKDLHFLRCPKCGMVLETIIVQSVQVDRCSSCHGTWLDEGELEQLAAREPGLLQKIIGVFRHF